MFVNDHLFQNKPFANKPVTFIFELLYLFSLLKGKGQKLSFILDEDYHPEYSNEDSTAYDILAQNVKQEVGCGICK